MPTFQIIEAKPYHCGQMVRALRYEHQSALMLLGVDSHRELRALFDQSAFRKAWLIDGKLAALGGVSGMQLSAIGFVWLCLSEQARKYPVAIIKEARRQLDQIMIVKRELATTIISGDVSARRLAIFLGFHVAHEGPGSQAHSRFARRYLARHVETNADLRIPFGQGYVIPMGFHKEDAV